MPLRSEEPHLSFCYGEQFLLLTLAHTLAKFLNTTPLTHLNIYTTKFLATLDDVRVPFVRNGCNNFSGIGFATPRIPIIAYPRSSENPGGKRVAGSGPRAGVECVAGGTRRRCGGAVEAPSVGISTCQCAVVQAEEIIVYAWAGGGAREAPGAGSEREKGAAEGGWGFERVQLRPSALDNCWESISVPRICAVRAGGQRAVGNFRRRGARESPALLKQCDGIEESLQWEVSEGRVKKCGVQQQLCATKEYLRAEEWRHEVNRTKQRNFTEDTKLGRVAAGEGERMWREEESIDAFLYIKPPYTPWRDLPESDPININQANATNPRISEAPKTGKAGPAQHALPKNADRFPDGSKRGALPKKVTVRDISRYISNQSLLIYHIYYMRCTHDFSGVSPPKKYAGGINSLLSITRRDRQDLMSFLGDAENSNIITNAASQAPSAQALMALMQKAGG
ncbi:hypothetical protein B0H14DRAFT_2602245 [Mycena olivaceomarginata]|nr:hypothetical protein B0H14DRAFT_2602245 [Mycena olivaceomarginata]